jgi:predicted nucleic acid-binding protein
MQDLLLDTNVLMLLLIGRWDRASIPTFRRTSTFTPADFDLLERTLSRYPRRVTTPAVLAEVSNLMGNAFHEKVAGTVVQVCGTFIERWVPKDQVFADEEFARLGFADASILAAADADTVVLTEDVHLYLAALRRGFLAVNFSHLRT